MRPAGPEFGSTRSTVINHWRCPLPDVSSTCPIATPACPLAALARRCALSRSAAAHPARRPATRGGRDRRRRSPNPARSNFSWLNGICFSPPTPRGVFSRGGCITHRTKLRRRWLRNSRPHPLAKRVSTSRATRFHCSPRGRWMCPFFNYVRPTRLSTDHFRPAEGFRLPPFYAPSSPKIAAATPSPLSIAPWMDAEFTKSPATQTPGRTGVGARRSSGRRTGSARRTR